MKRAIPWVIAAVALIAFGASFSELQRMRGRFGEVSRHQFHDHKDIRAFIIKTALMQSVHPIVVIGDSITEMARLPDTIGNNPIINAGIGGATVEDFKALASRLFEGVKPSMIVIALGTNNDAAAIGEDYGALIATLKKLAPKVLAVAVTMQNGAALKNAQIKAAADREKIPFVEVHLPEDSTLQDHLHLNAAGYKKWTPDIVAAITNNIS